MVIDPYFVRASPASAGSVAKDRDNFLQAHRKSNVCQTALPGLWGPSRVEPQVVSDEPCSAPTHWLEATTGPLWTHEEATWVLVPKELWVGQDSQILGIPESRVNGFTQGDGIEGELGAMVTPGN